MQKVTVTGYVKPNKVLKKVKCTGKSAELWPYVPYSSVTQPFSTQNYDKKAPAGFVRKESFNTSLSPTAKMISTLLTCLVKNFCYSLVIYRPPKLLIDENICRMLILL